MSIKCPLMSRNLVIADDARLAAQLSCALSETGRYLPVIEGPRMSRADSEAEIARRNNAASRVKPEVIFLAGLPDHTAAALLEPGENVDATRAALAGKELADFVGQRT